MNDFGDLKLKVAKIKKASPPIKSIILTLWVALVSNNADFYHPSVGSAVAFAAGGNWETKSEKEGGKGRNEGHR